ncbi:MAG: phosphotransferase [Candidatus Dormibacteria bacterium]
MSEPGAVGVVRAGTIREAATVEDLLAGATDRRPMKTADSLSGSHFERAVIEGRRYVVKYLCIDDDWIMRATGDMCCRQLQLWRSSIPSRFPAEIDHAVAGFAVERSPSGRVSGVLLLRDVGEHLVMEGGDPLSAQQEHHFLTHMAALHAAFWGWRDSLGLMPLSHHYVALTPIMAALEAAGGGNDPVPPLVRRGWERLPERAPRAAPLLAELAHDPWPLVAALEETPATLIHADWKLGNLGAHPDGRTILLDWDRCGRGAACMDLAWYLAVNCDRLPHTKEEAIEGYRASLEAAGVETGGWFERQLGLALVGALLQLGWTKTDGDAAELRWWENRAMDAQHHLR